MITIAGWKALTPAAGNAQMMNAQSVMRNAKTATGQATLKTKLTRTARDAMARELFMLALPRATTMNSMSQMKEMMTDGSSTNNIRRSSYLSSQRYLLDRLVQDHKAKEEKKMAELKVIIPGLAKPQGSKTGFVNKKTGKVILVEASKGLKSWRDEASGLIRAEAERQGWKLVEKGFPVVVYLDFVLMRPKAKGSNPNWATSKPDADKLARSCLDAITQAGNVWWDDCQVHKLVIHKSLTSYVPHTNIIIEAD